MLVHHHSFFVTLPTHFPLSLSLFRLFCYPIFSALSISFPLLDLVTSTAPFPVNPVHVIPPSTHPGMVSRFYYALCMMDPFILCPMCVRFLFSHFFFLDILFFSLLCLLLLLIYFAHSSFSFLSILPFFFLSPTNLSPLLITESIHSFSHSSSSLHIRINCIFFLPFWLAVFSFSIWYEIHSVSDDNHFLGSEESRKKDGKWPMK